MNELSDVFKCLIIVIDNIQSKGINVGIHQEQLDECLKVCLCLMEITQKEPTT
jgi:hypothetical protein